MSTLAILLLASAPAFAVEDPSDPRPVYCEEPNYIVRGEPEAHDSPRDEDVLNPEEAADPAIAQTLAATPGPYGHSELGFRYLARLFGYTGSFSSREKVEAWLSSQEAEHNAAKKGMWKLWEKWVVNPGKRLAVPRVAVSELPRYGDPDMFFLDSRDRAAHSKCLKTELAAQLCQNYEGRGRAFKDADMILYSASSKGAEKFGYCQVRLANWRKAQEKHEMKAYLEGARLKPDEVKEYFKPDMHYLEDKDDKANKTAK